MASCYILILSYLTWNDVRWNKERDPGDDDKEARGEVVGDDVVGHVAHQDHLEACQAETGRDKTFNSA